MAFDVRFYRIGESRYAYCSERLESLFEALPCDFPEATECPELTHVEIRKREYEPTGVRDNRGWWHYREKYARRI